ncbi:hypothetical protein [Agarivorans sp. JK6]|uniref:hypothetical protein n=1 Tax=Agarivorans sp. JK6 TaxID=2997426 RepID=UPI0038737A51
MATYFSLAGKEKQAKESPPHITFILRCASSSAPRQLASLKQALASSLDDLRYSAVMREIGEHFNS